MNLVQTKLRNRLNDESANMPLFIRINEIALRRRETIDRRATMAQDDRDREIAQEQEEQHEQGIAAEDLVTAIIFYRIYAQSCRLPVSAAINGLSTGAVATADRQSGRALFSRSLRGLLAVKPRKFSYLLKGQLRTSLLGKR
ncbi:uncharacterized protein PV07_12639 [Cladophialophora immunda]|uniref:Uncharacterized protein n=1 Tax=Cladophialophora immunda TaxID=569365 RepID=A0A0D2BU70_9EURO|nr:uncharacterized protein PV07_12639 [Cladophialophora immunda]KIW21955.1 hypothetical protein PV07_12639 [Cladophialophora immunda]